MKLPWFLLIALALSACSQRTEYSGSSKVAPSVEAVNINTATAADLERLPHIGKKTAEAIVGFREANGRFRRVEQVMLIPGISESRFIELRPYLRAE